MKNKFTLFAAAAITLLALAHSYVMAQTTNSGVTVTQANVTTNTPPPVTTYKAAHVTANAATTSALVTNFFNPMLNQVGVQIPAGTVVRVYTVQFYSDGSSSSVVNVCDPSKLPAPPPAPPQQSQ